MRGGMAMSVPSRTFQFAASPHFPYAAPAAPSLFPHPVPLIPALGRFVTSAILLRAQRHGILHALPQSVCQERHETLETVRLSIRAPTALRFSTPRNGRNAVRSVAARHSRAREHGARNLRRCSAGTAPPADTCLRRHRPSSGTRPTRSVSFSTPSRSITSATRS